MRSFLIGCAIVVAGLVAGGTFFGRQMLDVAYAATYREQMVAEFHAGCLEGMRETHTPADVGATLCQCFAGEFRSMPALRAAAVVMSRATAATAPEFRACRARHATA